MARWSSSIPEGDGWQSWSGWSVRARQYPGRISCSAHRRAEYPEGAFRHLVLARYGLRLVLQPLTSTTRLLRSDVLRLVTQCACPRIMTRPGVRPGGRPPFLLRQKGDPRIAPAVWCDVRRVEYPEGAFHQTVTTTVQSG